MTPEQLAEIEAAARAADGPGWYDHDDLGVVEYADAEFIMRANPKVVLALITDLRAIDELREGWRKTEARLEVVDAELRVKTEALTKIASIPDDPRQLHSPYPANGRHGGLCTKCGQLYPCPIIVARAALEVKG